MHEPNDYAVPPRACPVDPQTKQWIEEQLLWLTESFGYQEFCEARVIRPTAEFFPDPYHEQEADVEPLLRQTSQYMGVGFDRVRLRFFREVRGRDANGIRLDDGNRPTDEEGRFVIWVDALHLEKPLQIVGTIAVELARFRLLTETRLNPHAAGSAVLRDLLTVFRGLGVITANSQLLETNSRSGPRYSWTHERRGGLTHSAFGYALALFAWCRGEEQADWIGDLRPDVHSAFRVGLHYLQQTCDSSFNQKSAARQPAKPPSQVDLRPFQFSCLDPSAPQPIDESSAKRSTLATHDGLQWVHAVCTTCSQQLAFPLTLGGTVQECPSCESLVNVPLDDRTYADRVRDHDKRSLNNDDSEKSSGHATRWLRFFGVVAVTWLGIALLWSRMTPSEQAAGFCGLCLGVLFTGWWAQIVKRDWQAKNMWQSRIIIPQRDDND